MINKLILVAIVFSLSGCISYASTRTMTQDLKQTAYCDTSPVLLDSEDYTYSPHNERMRGKIFIANKKLKDCDDAIYSTEKKLKKYGEL